MLTGILLLIIGSIVLFSGHPNNISLGLALLIMAVGVGVAIKAKERKELAGLVPILFGISFIIIFGFNAYHIWNIILPFSTCY